jgi:RNA polymerase sigma-70 factor (sigma-E family)
VKIESGELAVGEPEAAGAGSSRPSLEELYRRHVGRAVALGRLLTGDPHLAEDLAHEAFLRAAGRFGRLKDPGLFEGYLLRAVVNLSRSRFRRLRIERAYLRSHRAPNTATPEYVSEERDLVWSAILRLPHRQRAAIVLRYYEDQSEEQTGQILRCSTRAVNALVSRAMASLRASLIEEDR